MMAAFEPLGLDGVQRIYVDLPGVGSSPGGPWHLGRHRGDALRVLEPLPARRCSAGCSYGGYLAAAVARRIPVEALLLICHGTRIKFEERDLAGTGSELPDGAWLDGVPPDLRSHLRNALGVPDADVAARVAAVVAAADTGDADYLHAICGRPATNCPMRRPKSGLTVRRASLPAATTTSAGYNDHVSLAAAICRTPRSPSSPEPAITSR